MLMTGSDYRESLRRLKPRVFVEGRAVSSIADDPALAPGVAAMGVAYDFALRNEFRPLMVAEQHTSGREVNRMLHINRTSTDLLTKLEAVRLVCQETGCAQRYLTMDAFNALFQTTWQIDRERDRGRHQRKLGGVLREELEQARRDRLDVPRRQEDDRADDVVPDPDRHDQPATLLQ